MSKLCYFLIVLLVNFSYRSVCYGLRKYNKEDIIRLREEVREMFQHAYDSYLRYAYPYDELRPLSCDGIDTWGSYSLTLIDALDTLAIMGNYTEFNRVVDLVLKRKDFDSDINVSVFETNIRIVGGLLSAHLLSHKTGMKLEPGWPCNGPLLRLAEDAAQRLIAAFDTVTGMPYGTINLRSGVPPGETSVTCTAGVGTFIIEFGTLSRLTGDPLYEEVAYNALKALYNHKSAIGLVGNHIDVMTGKWTAEDAGIGGGVDSYFEYLVKGAILLEKPELMSMFSEARAVIDRYLRKEDWYVWGTMARGSITLPVFQSLESYWPGVLTLIGESDSALRIIHNYHSIWRQYGFTPEMYNLGTGEASVNKESYPLRPELIESIMYLYRETRDPVLLQMGEDILRSIQHSARTPCGYATIKDVRTHLKDDRMESFFLSETTKYLYLLFDPDNFIHNPGDSGKLIDTANGQCVIDVGGYIFNTEAHPVDPTILHCCHEARKGLNLSEVHRIYEILEEEDNIKLMTLIEGTGIENTNDSTAMDEQSDTNISTEDEADPIKTETRTGYVNIDGTERDKAQANVSQIIDHFFNKEETQSRNTVQIEDISVPSPKSEIILPSTIKARETFKLLPKVIQDFINNGWKSRTKCEPQYMLERIRKDVTYPRHPDEDMFELLLTPAPTFLQRISLAGEFLNKKEL